MQIRDITVPGNFDGLLASDVCNLLLIVSNFSKIFFLMTAKFNLFSFDLVNHKKKFEKKLIFNSTKQQNLRPVQIQSICRRQIKGNSKLEICFGMEENILGKGEKAGYQHFLLFPKCFQKPPSSGSLKVDIVW